MQHPRTRTPTEDGSGQWTLEAACSSGVVQFCKICIWDQLPDLEFHFSEVTHGSPTASREAKLNRQLSQTVVPVVTSNMNTWTYQLFQVKVRMASLKRKQKHWLRCERFKFSVIISLHMWSNIKPTSSMSPCSRMNMFYYTRNKKV